MLLYTVGNTTQAATTGPHTPASGHTDKHVTRSGNPDPGLKKSLIRMQEKKNGTGSGCNFTIKLPGLWIPIQGLRNL